MMLKNSVFVVALITLLPLFLTGFTVGIVCCGLRAGWHAADSFAVWITQ